MHGIRLLTGGFQVRALAVEAFPVDTIKAIAVEKKRSGTLFLSPVFVRSTVLPSACDAYPPLSGRIALPQSVSPEQAWSLCQELF